MSIRGRIQMAAAFFRPIFSGLTAGLLAASAFAVVPIAAARAAGALSVEPLFLEVAPLRATTIRVVNNSERTTTVEMTIEERLVDENGVQTRVPADDEFIVLPPQAAIESGQIQGLRVQPLFADLGKSRSFYATVRQLPVNLEPGEGTGAKIQVVFAFDVALHVVPRGAEAKYELRSATLTRVTAPETVVDRQLVTSETGQKMVDLQGVAVELANPGNKYLYVQDLEYSATGMTADGKAVDIPRWSSIEVIDAAKIVLIPPASTRKFVLPLRNVPELASVSLRVRRPAKQ